MTTHFDFQFSQKGWECPKCGRCYNPCILVCWNCNRAAERPQVHGKRWHETTTIDTSTAQIDSLAIYFAHQFGDEADALD